jgi:hypothetical protein
LYEFRTSGTYYEIGLQTGKILKKEMDGIPGFPPKFSEEKIEIGMKYEREVERRAPELLEELRGIADGSSINYDVLATFELSPLRMRPSCTVMAIAGAHTRSGLPILARNHEWLEEDGDYLSLCHTKPEGRIGSLGFTFVGMNLSRFGGINEAGLALSSAAASFEDSGPGVMFNVATRWMLDNCSTAEEAVAFLMKAPKVWGVAYLMIDRNNTIVKVEAHRERTKVTHLEEGFGMVTLLFDSPEMRGYNDHGANLSDRYYSRKEFIPRWFVRNRGKIDHDKIMEALKDHEHKMCDHFFDGRDNYGVCWSWIVAIGEDDALVCAGPPCKNEYKRHSLS